MPRLATTSAGGTHSTLCAPPASATQRGTVTAETAMVLPVLAALTLALVWGLALAVTQVRVVDAARETARAIARGDDRAQALELGRRVAPDAASIAVSDEGGTVAVDVVVAVGGPGGLLRLLPEVRVSSRAVAAKEGS